MDPGTRTNPESGGMGSTVDPLDAELDAILAAARARYTDQAFLAALRLAVAAQPPALVREIHEHLRRDRAALLVRRLPGGELEVAVALPTGLAVIAQLDADALDDPLDQP